MHLARFDARQLHQALNETVEAVRFFVYDFEHLLPAFPVELNRLLAFGVRPQLVEQSRDRSLDGSERRSEVMCDGVEQGRLQALALLGGLRLARALESVLELAVQALDLAPPHVGLFGAAARARRKLPGRNRR